MSIDQNTRPLESGIVRDFTGNLSYGRYLHLDELLAAQHPLSRPELHDELLFVIQHQTPELWLKLVLHGGGRHVSGKFEVCEDRSGKYRFGSRPATGRSGLGGGLRDEGRGREGLRVGPGGRRGRPVVDA